jgi:hypothetical protein
MLLVMIERRKDMRSLILLQVMALLLVLILAGCGFGVTPDWQARYSEHLGRQVVELDETTLKQGYLDPHSGALTRAAWARFRDGTMALLGLPAHSLDAAEVVDRTVVLEQQAWQRACANALGEDEVWGWRLPHGHRGNAIRIYLNNQHDRYCEFFFLPEGWELRAVESYGTLKASQ